MLTWITSSASPKGPNVSLFIYIMLIAQWSLKKEGASLEGQIKKKLDLNNQVNLF